MPTATIYEVAQEAGTAKSTASDILNRNRHDLYRPETVARVQEAAKKLGYQVHSGARSLRLQNSTVIGLAMRPEMLDWHTVNSLIVATYSELSARGLQPVIVDAEQMVPGKTIASFPSPDLLAGVISVDLALEEQTPDFYKVLAAKLPVLALYPVRSREIDYVTTDRAAGIEKAVEHLVDLGHRRIVFAEVVDSNLLTVTAKQQGWEKACHKHNLDAQCIVPLVIAESVKERGEKIASTLQEMKRNGTPPTALLTAGDEVAFWIMRNLPSAGWKIGHDLSLVGFDNIAFAKYSSPALTTVAQPVREIAKRAVLRLVKMIEANRKGEVLPVQRTLLKPEIIIRESSKPPLDSR